jgi:hypothetical protein
MEPAQRGNSEEVQGCEILRRETLALKARTSGQLECG